MLSLGVRYFLRKDDQELEDLKLSAGVYHMLHLYKPDAHGDAHTLEAPHHRASPPWPTCRAPVGLG